MLYWICPECGHECSPAIRECPTCTAPPESEAAAPARSPKADDTPTIEMQRPSGVSEGLLSLAQNFQSSGSGGLLSAAPQRQLLTAATAAAVAVEEPEQAREPEPAREPEQAQGLASLGDLIIAPARPGRQEWVNLSPTPVPVALSAPVVASASAPQRAEFGLAVADVVPLIEVRFQGAQGVAPAPIDLPVEALPSQRRSVAFIREELPGSRQSGLGLGELIRPRRRSDKPSQQNSEPANRVSMPEAYQAGAPSFVPSQVQPSEVSLSGLLDALKASEEEMDRAGIEAIQASFSEQPVMRLLPAAEDIAIAPAPPSERWIVLPKPKFTPVAPEYTGRATVIAGPQAPPLAGPSLPPKFVNLDQQNSRLKLKGKRMSAWPLTLLIGTVIILGGGSLMQYVGQDRDTKAASAAGPAQTVPSAPIAVERSVTAVLREHAAAKSVEVAGIRIVSGPGKRPQLQYLVINHSVNELSGLNIRVAVRSVDAPEGPPLFTVSSAVAALGPNQSKEIRTELDPSIKPSSIPDWQSLRTEVMVARQ